MSNELSLSTIATLIEWLEKYDAIGHQSPLLFVKKNFCDQKLFVNQKLEVEIFENICKYRKFIEFLLKSKNLEVNVKLIVHLYLMTFLMSESTKTVILESLDKNFMRDVVNSLMDLINSRETVMAGEDREPKCELIAEKSSELLSFQVPPPPTPSTRPPSTSCPSTRSAYTIKKTRESNNSVVSENKLDKIIENLPKKRQKITKTFDFKKNTASVLRTGALVNYKLKFNDSMINNIVAGSSNPMAISDHVNKILELSHLKELREIERKHLLGLISLEEAKIAKVEAIKKNQAVVEEMKIERQKLLELIRSEKEEQAFKSKFIIKKTHLGRLKAKKSYFDVVSEKKMTAVEIRRINEQFQKQIEKSKSEELARKTELIKKIKALEEKSKTGRLNRPKLDEYQKMSILELKDSIHKLNQQLEEEKILKQQKIAEERDRQKKLLANTQALIQVHRLHRTKPIKITRDVEPTPDLMKLRQKLVQMRQLTSKS